MTMTFNQIWHLLTPLYDEREAKAIARMVLEVAFGFTLTDIYMGKVTQLSAEDAQELQEFIKRLQQGEPVQYVLGIADFAGRQFKVRRGVLIPRPETAGLCRWIASDWPQDACMLDIGTGSGCIAVTLALDTRPREVEAWDISPEALQTARDNADRLGAEVVLRKQDIMRAPDHTAHWDVIVSNPPYIAEHEKAQMAPNVLNYEPETALFVPDDDPLRFYRAIAHYARKALKPTGNLYFEINPLYVKSLCEMLSTEGFGNIEVRQDDYGHSRMLRTNLLS